MKVDQKLKHINTDQQVLYTYQQFTKSSNIRQFSHLPFHPSLSTTHHHNERGLYSSNDNNNVKYCSTSNNSNISDNNNMQHTFHKVNSMNKINNSVNSSSNNNNNSNIVNNSKSNFNITTFTNKNECHSSYISVTLHILYEMPFIRSFFLNMKSISLPDNANKHNVITLLQQLKQIFIYNFNLLSKSLYFI